MTIGSHNLAIALRAKLNAERPAIAMAAHNSLASKLAAEAGFDAVWGSGFELSASYAVPDASILPMSTHLEMMRACASVAARSWWRSASSRASSRPRKPPAGCW